DRRSRPERQALQGATGLGRSRRAAMRLLPVRNDHGGLGAARREAKTDRQGHRRRDHQYLPLWDIPASAGSDPHGGERVREGHMNFVPKMNRRSFLVSTAAAGGGLALGISLAPESASAQTSLSTPELGVWVVV